MIEIRNILFLTYFSAEVAYALPLENEIRKKAVKLELYFPRVVRGRVVIEAPDENAIWHLFRRGALAAARGTFQVCTLPALPFESLWESWTRSGLQRSHPVPRSGRSSTSSGGGALQPQRQ
jgi:hypothetical protein